MAVVPHLFTRGHQCRWLRCSRSPPVPVPVHILPQLLLVTFRNNTQVPSPPRHLPRCQLLPTTATMVLILNVTDPLHPLHPHPPLLTPTKGPTTSCPPSGPLPPTGIGTPDPRSVHLHLRLIIRTVWGTLSLPFPAGAMHPTEHPASNSQKSRCCHRLPATHPRESRASPR